MNIRDVVLHETFNKFYEPILSNVFKEKFDIIIRDLNNYAGREVAAETLWKISNRGPIPRKTISEKDFKKFIKQRDDELIKEGKIDAQDMVVLEREVLL